MARFNGREDECPGDIVSLPSATFRPLNALSLQLKTRATVRRNRVIAKNNFI